MILPDPQQGIAIDGRALAREYRDLHRQFFSKLARSPVLHIIIFRDTGPTRSFVRIKQSYAQAIGVETQIHDLSAQQLSQVDAESYLRDISNNAREGDGIVVQLPLPDAWDTDSMLSAFDRGYDVDVLQSLQRARIEGGIIPPVAGAVLAIAHERSLSLSDEKVLIIGRGRLVGDAVAQTLEVLGTAFQQIDETTSDPESYLADATLVISGAGDAHFIRPGMLRDGVAVIDAGTSTHEGALLGDLHPDSYAHCRWYTPVPGGVGPLTVSMIFENLAIMNDKNYVRHTHT